jgi:hypothetical protein
LCTAHCIFKLHPVSCILLSVEFLYPSCLFYVSRTTACVPHIVFSPALHFSYRSLFPTQDVISSRCEMGEWHLKKGHNIHSSQIIISAAYTAYKEQIQNLERHTAILM